MAAASALVPTGMSAVLGGDPDEVLARLAELDLVPANMNGAGQVVAAGAAERLAELTAAPPAKARVVPLSVAGAFHTHFMASAQGHLRDLAAGLRPAEPAGVLLSNADGRPVADGAAGLDALVAQVTRPVRWDLCQAALPAHGVEAIIELPPAGTLTNLAKRALPQVPGLAVKSPADLAAARELVAKHTSGGTA
jgi:[acyl-carrier-protein] S-malonyltransferase